MLFVASSPRPHTSEEDIRQLFYAFVVAGQVKRTYGNILFPCTGPMIRISIYNSKQTAKYLRPIEHYPAPLPVHRAPRRRTLWFCSGGGFDFFAVEVNEIEKEARIFRCRNLCQCSVACCDLEDSEFLKEFLNFKGHC
jgi:hypothetical protein